MQRATAAHCHATWRGIRVDTGLEALFQTIFDSVRAEVAFGANTFPAFDEGIGPANLRACVRIEGVLIPINRPRIVRTGQNAVSAPDAFFFVNLNDPIILPRGRPGGTDIVAGRTFTVHATPRRQQSFSFRGRRRLDSAQLSPHALRNTVCLAAGQNAGATADTTIQIDQHHPVRHDKSVNLSN
jgi:hypothetical protein